MLDNCIYTYTYAYDNHILAALSSYPLVFPADARIANVVRCKCEPVFMMKNVETSYVNSGEIRYEAVVCCYLGNNVGNTR